MSLEILAILLLVALNGLLAGAEIAIVAVRRTRLDELVREGHGAARILQRIRGNPEAFLATVQVGITVVSAAAAAFGGARLATRIASVARDWPVVGPHAEGLALALVVGLVSFLSVVVGELVPKSLALRASERYALLAARPIDLLSRLARPAVSLLTRASNVVLSVFHDRTSFVETRLSPDELRQMLEDAGTAGSLDPRAGEIAIRALDLGELEVSEVMVPRRQVVTLADTLADGELMRAVTEGRHARYPVHHDTPDTILGYLVAREVLARGLEPRPFTARDLLREGYFAPESMPAVSLLNELRHRRIPLAFVVDERGSLAGIVTVEDLVEELVGDIFEEHDASPPPPLHADADGSFVVQGTATVRELNRAAELELPEGDWVTVAGLCVARHGDIPAAGTVVELEDGTRLEVLEASPRRVRVLRIRPAPAAAAPGSAS